MNGTRDRLNTAVFMATRELLRADSGAITIDDTRIDAMSARDLARFRALRIGFIFQAINLLSALTVRENVLFPARFGVGLSPAVERRGAQPIEKLGLNPRRDALPAQLSGGEKQRVAIARALINDPPVILADEPTGNLDSTRGQEVMMILHDVVRGEGKSVLIVTHDPRVEDVSDRLLWLEDGALRDPRPRPGTGSETRCAVCAWTPVRRPRASNTGAADTFSARIAAGTDSPRRRTRTFAEAETFARQRVGASRCTGSAV